MKIINKKDKLEVLQKSSKGLWLELTQRSPAEQVKIAAQMWVDTMTTVITPEKIKLIYPADGKKELDERFKKEQKKLSFMKIFYTLLTSQESQVKTSKKSEKNETWEKNNYPTLLLTVGRTKIKLADTAELENFLAFLDIKDISYSRTSTHDFDETGKEIKTYWGGVKGAIDNNNSLDYVLKNGGTCHLGIDIPLGGFGNVGLDNLPITSNGKNGTVLLVIKVNPRTKAVDVLMSIEDSAPHITTEPTSILSEKIGKSSATGQTHSLVGATSNFSPTGCNKITFEDPADPLGSYLKDKHSKGKKVKLPDDKYDSFKLNVKNLDHSLKHWKESKKELDKNLPEDVRKKIEEAFDVQGTSLGNKSFEYLSVAPNSILLNKIKKLEGNLADLRKYADKTTSEGKKEAIKKLVKDINNAKELLIKRQMDVRTAIKKNLDLLIKAKKELLAIFKDKNSLQMSVDSNYTNFHNTVGQEIEKILKAQGGSDENIRKKLENFKIKCKSYSERKPQIEKGQPPVSTNELPEAAYDFVIAERTKILEEAVNVVDRHSEKEFHVTCKKAYEQPAVKKLKNHSDHVMIRFLEHVVLAVSAIIGGPLIKWAKDYKKTGGEFTWPFFTGEATSKRKADRVKQSFEDIANPKIPSDELESPKKKSRRS